LVPSGQTEPGQRQKRQRSASQRQQSTQRRRVRPGDDVGVIPVLARAAREVETAVQKGPLKPANRARFQVATLLLREERARVKADKTLTDAERASITEMRLRIVAAKAGEDLGALSKRAEGALAVPVLAAMNGLPEGAKFRGGEWVKVAVKRPHKAPGR